LTANRTLYVLGYVFDGFFLCIDEIASGNSKPLPPHQTPITGDIFR